MDTATDRAAREALAILSVSPIRPEVHAAAGAHPSNRVGPSRTAVSRHTRIVVMAQAMDEACGHDRRLPRPDRAVQAVDDAVEALGQAGLRKAPPILAVTVEARHVAMARRLSGVSTAVEAGYDAPSSIARSEEAIGRVLRMRLGEDEGAHDGLTSAMTVSIVGSLIRVCGSRSTPITDLDDSELVQLVEDCFDASSWKEDASAV